MIIPWLIPAAAALGCAFLAALVWLQGRKSELRNVFVFLASALILMNLFSVVLYSAHDPTWAFEATRLLRVGTIFVQPAVLHLALALLGNRSRYWSGILALDYGLAAIFTLANAADLFVSSVTHIPWGFATVPTPYYNILTLYAVINLATAVIILIYNYQSTSEPNARLQAKFWLVGVAAGALLALTNLLPAYGIPIYPPGNLASAVFCGFVAYGIIQHRLMDIDVFLTKGLAYFAVTIFLVVPSAAIVMEIQDRSYGATHTETTAIILTLMIAISLLAPRAIQLAETRLEASLLRHKQHQRQQLAHFGRSIVKLFDEDRIAKTLCDTVAHVFGIDDLALYLNSGDGPLRLNVRNGMQTLPNDFSPPEILTQWLLDHPGPFLATEIASTSDQNPPAADSPLSSKCWSVCLPFIGADDSLLGLLFLGQKTNRNAYVTSDLELLSSVGIEAAIGLENTRLHQELRRSEDIINRAGRLSSLGTLAAGIAHEIRNPLVPIKTFLDLAPHRMNDEEFMTTFLHLAGEELGRIQKLVSELLAFGKSTTATISKINLEETAERVYTLLGPEARQAGVELVRFPPNNIPLVTADEDQIRQVIVNLVLNAIQATPRDGRVTVSLRGTHYGGRHYAQIEVEDSGVGIPQEMHEAIFNPFFTTKEKGTGLGLAIVHRIIQDAGGSIELKSAAGEGTRFTIFLPATGEEVEAESTEGLALKEAGRRYG